MSPWMGVVTKLLLSTVLTTHTRSNRNISAMYSRPGREEEIRIGNILYRGRIFLHSDPGRLSGERRSS
jgi:hypothetical protein